MYTRNDSKRASTVGVMMSCARCAIEYIFQVIFLAHNSPASSSHLFKWIMDRQISRCKNVRTFLGWLYAKPTQTHRNALDSLAARSKTRTENIHVILLLFFSGWTMRIYGQKIDWLVGWLDGSLQYTNHTRLVSCCSVPLILSLDRFANWITL